MEFFNPLTNRKPVTPEGHMGENASMYLPFYSYGRWFSSGIQLTFLTGEIRQRGSTPLNGLTRPGIFRKDASSCPIDQTAVI